MVWKAKSTTDTALAQQPFLRAKKDHTPNLLKSITPSAARSSEHRLQIFSTMLDAIEEEVCLFCAMCLVRVGRGMTQIQQCNTLHKSTTDGGLCPALTSTCGQRGPAHSTCGLIRSPSVARILHAVHYRSVLIVQAVKRVHQPVRRPVHIPTVETAHLLTHHRTGFAAKLPEQIHCSLAPFGQFHTFHSGVANPARRLHMLASTKNSYIGCAATSCSASPHGGLYIWRSNSVLRGKGRHSPHGIF